MSAVLFFLATALCLLISLGRCRRGVKVSPNWPKLFDWLLCLIFPGHFIKSEQLATHRKTQYETLDTNFSFFPQKPYLFSIAYFSVQFITIYAVVKSK